MNSWRHDRHVCPDDPPTGECAQCEANAELAKFETYDPDAFDAEYREYMADMAAAKTFGGGRR